ncbi:MAG: hypothetical protein AB7P69_24080, partial [Candidatus Binatia bacterium]
PCCRPCPQTRSLACANRLNISCPHCSAAAPQILSISMGFTIELVYALNEVTDNDREVVAAAISLVNSGRVQLCGNFANAKIVCCSAFDPVQAARYLSPQSSGFTALLKPISGRPTLKKGNKRAIKIASLYLM